jgi:hypothetical protein
MFTNQALNNTVARRAQDLGQIVPQRARTAAEKDNEDIDDAVSRQIAYRQETEKSWLYFCMFPDLYEPKRMPSLFPVPTHVIRRQRVFNITQVAAGNTIYCLWKPEGLPQLSAGLGISANYAFLGGFRPVFDFTEATSSQLYSTNTDVQSPAVSSYYTPSVTCEVDQGTGALSFTNVAHGGVRMIGAFCEIEYVGTLENHSGMIECGLHLASANSLYDVSCPHLMDQTEMIQSPFYRKFKPLDGCRVVWFPVDNADFEFNEYATDYQSRMLTLDGNPGAQITSVNVGANDVRNYSQAYGPLKKTVRPEWAINISGLQVGQAVRVHMCAYYETVPDESYRDLFLPKRTREYTDPAKVKSAATILAQQGVVATPAKTSGSWSNIAAGIGKAIDVVATGLGMAGLTSAGALLGGPGGMIAGASLGGLLSAYGSKNSMSLE